VLRIAVVSMPFTPRMLMTIASLASPMRAL
jgi:hypothetical protein